MLVVNKLCLTYIQAPNLVLFVQLTFNAVAIAAMDSAQVVKSEPLEPVKARAFVPVVLLFIGTLFANLKAIQRVPIDTFICARSSTPIAVSVLEYFFLGRAVPSARSCVGLGLIVAGVILYVKLDVWFDAVGYFWLGMWYFLAIVEMIWVKHVVDVVPMSTWGRCYYQNALSVPFTIILGLAFGEASKVRNQVWDVPALQWLFASCIAAVGMSYMSFLLRDLVSATSFSVVGNMCKVATIVVNFRV